MATKAVAVVEEISNDELTALLQSAGWAEKPSADAVPRLKLDGSLLTASDTGEMFVYNPTKPKVPAMTARIARPPEEYYAIWIDDEAALKIGRPELAKTFSKKFVNPDPTRRVWESDAAYDQLINAGIKSSWKADIYLQIVPDSGKLQGDETIYVLTLNTTSLIEFKGTGKNPEGGVVEDKNFIRKLSLFALSEAKGSPKKAVLDALTSLMLGGVVVEVRLVRAENKELGRTWTVIVFEPVYIEAMQEGDTLLTSGETDDTEKEDLAS